MIITLTGANSYLRQAELRSLVAQFISDYDDLGVEQIDGDEVEFNRISEALTSLPFLASKKLIILRHPSANKQFIEQSEVLLSGLPETTDVVIVEPKLDKRLSYYKYLSKQTDFHEYNELDSNGLASWLATAAKERGGTLSSSDARYLVERVGANQQLLDNELDKLLLYAPKISRQTIDLVTEATPQSTVFQLLEAAFAGNATRALELYGEQRALKVEPPQIIAMLSWQLHILAVLKTAGERSSDVIASEAHLSPYVVQKSTAIARKMSLGSLKTLLADLLTIDTRTKREMIDADEALQNFLLRLAMH